jgi:hypothetical protein
MTRKYSLVIQGDEAGYSAYVPELPTILITGRSIDELTVRKSIEFILRMRTNSLPTRSPAPTTPRTRPTCDRRAP